MLSDIFEYTDEENAAEYLNEMDVKKHAFLATSPSHNNKEAIDYATLIVLIIFLARKNYTKAEIFN